MYPSRVWEPTRVIEVNGEEIQLWASHERDQLQCKCGLWVGIKREEIDDHLLRKIPRKSL